MGFGLAIEFVGRWSAQYNGFQYTDNNSSIFTHPETSGYVMVMCALSTIWKLREADARFIEGNF